MTETPSAALLLELGGDLDYPSVSIGPTTVAGEEAWRATLPRATPAERREWFQALAPALLVCTPVAAERMAAWRARTWSPPPTPWRVADEILFFGDASMLAPVVAAFAFMPEGVQDFILRECAFLAVGADTYGWTGSSRFVDRDGISRPRVVLLSGSDRHAPGLIHATLHECAHAWTMATPSGLLSVQGSAGLRAHLAAARSPALERADAAVARDERLADALAQLWMP
jgi:hypothetical protein